MESKTVGWKIVPNTVTNRMIDFSLVHKLIPSRRLRRRCKVMNTIMKRRSCLKTYSEYVKIKTTVLRNVSDDEETDMSDNFTENDYSVFYKSDLSFTNYKSIISNQDDNYSSEEEFSFDENYTDYREINEKRKNRSKKNVESGEDQCLKTTKLGWQDVKNKSRSSLNTTKDSNTSHPSLIESKRTSDHADIENNVQMKNINKDSLTSLKESSLTQDSEILQNNEPCAIEKVSQSNAEVTNSNEIKQDITKLPEITDNDEKPVEKVNHVINNVNEGFLSNENHPEILNSSDMQTKESIKINLTPVLDDAHEIKNINDSVANKKVFLDESHSSSSERNPSEPEIPMATYKNNNKVLKIQGSVLGSTNQPKDSGIEEDTEEEILDNKYKKHKKERKKIQKTEQDTQSTPSISNQEDNPVTQTDLPIINDHLLVEDHNILSNTDHKNTTVALDDNIINSSKNQEKTPKQKPQPTVTCTEIMNRKYKIISCDTALLNNSPNSELSLSDFHRRKGFEIEEPEQNIEDSISPLTKKRLQQLRRLNLTIESESGLSEDDNTSWNTKNMRDNLLRRSRESPDMSDSEDKNVKSKLPILIQSDKKLQKNENSRGEDYKKGSTLQSINKSEKHMKHKKKKKSKKSKNNEYVDSLGFTEFNKCNSDKCITDCTIKSETDLNSVETYCQDGYPDESTSEQNSSINDSSFHYNRMEEEFNDENQLVGNMKKVLNEKKTIMHDRPCNLQELINKDNLIHRPVKPSFTFKDIYEDDIYILDIPATAFDNQLLGKKIILTEKKLKLGKQKYKVEFKDVGSISCVFGKKSPNKLYKTVNIKPTARIIARQKIIRTPLLKTKNQYLDESNCTEDDSQIEENETSTSRHIEMKNEIPFKKRRYNFV
nr:PREDICTED: altered inheritance of mitochondria protein 21-like [Megachile rotundata]